MSGGEGVGLILGALFILAVGIASAFFAPCGCYAGTPIKDVPARCTDVGGPTR